MPILFNKEQTRQIINRQFHSSSPGRKYSNEYKQGFEYAFETNFNYENRKCPYEEASTQCDAWWSGYGLAVKYLFYKADNEWKKNVHYKLSDKGKE